MRELDLYMVIECTYCYGKGYLYYGGPHVGGYDKRSCTKCDGKGNMKLPELELELRGNDSEPQSGEE